MNEEFGMYRLGFPNREVEEGFIRFLLPFYANVNKVESPFEIQKFVREVRSGDYNSFFRRLLKFLCRHYLRSDSGPGATLRKCSFYRF